MNAAAGSFSQALTVNPDYAVAHGNLGNTLKEQGNLDGAIASYYRALSLKPDYAEAYNSLGLIFCELGKQDDAIGCYRKAISLKPDYARAYRNLTSIEKFTAAHDDILLAMEDLYYKKKDMSDADRMDLGFALGKAFEDLKNYDKAFAFLLAANRLKRKSYEYSIEADHDLFERIKNTFSREFFASHQGSGNQDRTPVFILGMPRSGTTLVEQILASHPQVFGAGELMLLGDMINNNSARIKTQKFPEYILDLDMDALEKMGAEYIEEIRGYSKNAKYITDKMPHNFMYVGLIRIILPNAKVIHCTRSPMDNCFSIFKTKFWGTHAYAYQLDELGRYYNLYRDLMAHWEKLLPGFMYSLQYEELVSHQENRTKSLLDFCGLSWDAACMDFHKTQRRIRTASVTQARQPIYKDSVELWKCYEKQLEPLRKIIYEYQ